MKKITGYICLVLSFVAWSVIIALPFMDISNSEMVTTSTGLIISGEVLFIAAIALLGKEAWLKIKAIFKSKK
ncbi:transporter suffix domain-containing protein [Colwellia sp. 75C3]|uniref:transporter suffix domain-containing protein n=1 Tax=Colwellia sp. 75C3 TaxID=888425 RepID=UPI0012FF593B|nr:transporter suffix domain-containing protein [Colwellia sp. 75C3]